MSNDLASEGEVHLGDGKKLSLKMDGDGLILYSDDQIGIMPMAGNMIRVTVLRPTQQQKTSDYTIMVPTDQLNKDPDPEAQ